ncbi:MAG TPA: O-antigen ligase family protein, partial [Rhodothermales bacterium]|nr:O-antigen ligase family protein [Rhodothermales bacterium]
LFVYRERLLYTTEDKVWLAFLLLIPCTMPLGILFGGDTSAMMSEMIAWTMAAIYFPVKEACARYERGIPAILLVLALVGLGVALRNAYFFSQILSDATMAWQVATGRVASNDHLMMVSSLFGLALVIGARRGWHFTLLLGYFLIAFAGLILTQSRGYWVSFLLGAGAMFLFVDATYRKRMLLLGVLGIIALLGIGFVFFSSYIELMLGGIIKRFSTLQTAASSDLSLVNRFRETAAVWPKIVQNPILGYGMGVPYTFYDIAHEATDIDAFVHNGYVGLWYKFGLWGLGMVLFFWARSIWRGFQAFRLQGVSYWLRMAGLAASISLVAFTLSTITSNPFYLKDSIFVFSVLASIAVGAYHRGCIVQHTNSVHRLSEP